MKAVPEGRFVPNHSGVGQEQATADAPGRKLPHRSRLVADDLQAVMASVTRDIPEQLPDAVFRPLENAEEPAAVGENYSGYIHGLLALRPRDLNLLQQFVEGLGILRVGRAVVNQAMVAGAGGSPIRPPGRC